MNQVKTYVKPSQKPSIEKREYERFLADFKNGKCGTQRLGQAFYDRFKLYRFVNQAQLHNLYAKDGEHALRSINEIFNIH